MFEGKKILITGGTGSLGQALTKRLLTMKVDAIRILSRNENKQVAMKSELSDDRLRFLIGDIRDLPRLCTALEDIDIVFHTAALKHVPLVEYNPFEAIKTNVVGTQNVINACLQEGVKIAVGIGTDKASSPVNTYGATKLLMEKLFTSANYYTGEHQTIFFAVRYGNVLGSSGSVLPTFINQIKNKQKITITDPQMTRFSITMDEALDFILEAAKIAKGSETFIPKLKAYSIMDIKHVLADLLGDTGEQIIGIRPGERFSEILMTNYEITQAWEYDNKYILFSPLFRKYAVLEKLYPGIKKVENLTTYMSHTAEKLSIKDLKKVIISSGLLDKTL